jgi:hypothetical protein
MVDAIETSLIVAVASVVVGTPIAFFIKDYLVRWMDFRKFKDKLERIAGVNAEVLYPTVGGSLFAGITRTFKIVEISKQGLMLRDSLNTIFVPIERILNTEVVLPAENFDSLRKEKMRRDAVEAIDAIFPPLMDKMKEVFVTELLSPDSDLTAVVGVRVVSELRDAGVDTSKLLDKKPTLRRLFEQLEATDKEKKDD